MEPKDKCTTISESAIPTEILLLQLAEIIAAAQDIALLLATRLESERLESEQPAEHKPWCEQPRTTVLFWGERAKKQ